MSSKDALRWNKKYQKPCYNTYFKPRKLLIKHANYLPQQGLALDVAMGLGGNAGFLLERGLSVVGVDISEVAVRRAKNRFPQLMAVQADLMNFEIPAAHFDVILNFFYLQRSLFPVLLHALRPGGLLLVETMTQGMLKIRPDIDPAYLLAPDELHQMVAGLDIITYHEGWTLSRNHTPRSVASLVARLPEN